MAGIKIEDMFFDVFLKDNTDKDIEKIRTKLDKKLKLTVDVKAKVSDEDAVKRLQKAYEELNFAMSKTGKKLAEIKEQTRQANAQNSEMAKLTARVANAADGSYNQLKAKLDQITASYKKMTKESREGFAGGMMLMKIGKAYEQVNAIDQMINSLKRVRALQNEIKALQDPNSNTTKAIGLQYEAEQLKNIERLRVRINELTTTGSNSQKVALMQQELSTQEKFLTVTAELNAMRNTGSATYKLNTLQQELQLEQYKLNLLGQEAKLQAQIDFEKRNGVNLANKQAELDILRQLNSVNAEKMRIDHELAFLKTAEGKNLAAKRTELNLLKEETRLKNELRNLNGGGRTVIELQTEKQMREQIIKLRKEAQFLNSAEGKELMKLQQQVRKIKNEYLGINKAKAAGNTKAFMVTGNALKGHIPIIGDLLNYARNYVGVFGAVSFIQSLYRIRGEFERHEVAIKSILQSAYQARNLFGQLQGLAIESPFKFQEILSFSKQLSAFQIPGRELFDTTKRLADLSAGLGVDMSRLILAYGQVRSASVLRGQELRQFTEAGVPMVQMLADKFSELNGKMVTTGEVFKLISERAVPFEMVKDIIFDLTSEGGKFFEHQAIQAETLYGKVQKLGDAWQIMLNQIGQSNQSTLEKPLEWLLSIMQNWKTASRLLIDSGIFFIGRKFSGAEIFRTVNHEMALLNAITGSAGKKLNALERGFARVRFSASEAGKALRSFVSKNAWILAITAIAEVLQQVADYYDTIDEFNQSFRDSAKDVYDEIKQFTKSHADSIARIKNPEINIDTDEAQKSWEVLMDMLSKLPDADINISKLLGIEDLNERNREAVQTIENLKAIEQIMSEMPDYGSVTQDTVFWGLFGEGLESDAKDLADELQRFPELFRVTAKNAWDTEKAFSELVKTGDSPEFRNNWANFMAADNGFDDFREFNDEVIKSVQQSLVPRLQEAVRMGFADPTQLKAIVTQWESTVIQQFPKVGGQMAPLFYERVAAELGSYDFLKGIDFASSEETMRSFYAKLKQYASKEKKDIDKLWEDGSDVAMREIQETAQRMLDDSTFVSSTTYNTFKQLSDNINNLKTVFRINIGIETPGSIQRLLGNVNGGDKKTKGAFSYIYDSLLGGDDLLETKKKMKERKARIKEIKEQNESTAKSLEKLGQENAAWVKRFENEKLTTEEQQINSAAFQLGIDLSDEKKLKGGGKNKGGGKGKQTTDPFTEELKQQIEQIKSANEWYKKYTQLTSKSDAITKVKSMEGFAGLDSNVFADGMEKFYKDSIAKLKERLKVYKDKTILKSIQSAIDSISKDLESIKYDNFKKSIDRLIDKLNQAVESATKNWDLYEKLFEKTGNQDWSSQIAFMGNKPFENLRKQLESMFNQNPLNIDIKTALDMYESDRVGLKEMFDTEQGKAYYEILKKIVDLESNEYVKLVSEVADYIEKQLTNEEKIEQLEERRRTMIEQINKSSMPEQAKLTSIDAINTQFEREIQEINTEVAKSSREWVEAFEDAGGKSYRALVEQFDNARDYLNDFVKNPETGKYERKVNYKGEVTTQILTPKEYSNLKNQVISLYNEIKDQNPFRLLMDSIKGDGEDAPKTFSEKLFQVGVAISKITEQCADCTSSLSSMFEAMGNDEAADTMTLVTDELGAMSKIAQGVGTAMAGNPMGVVQAAGGVFDGITAFIKFHDKKLDRIIEESKLAYKKLQVNYEEITRTIERSLLGAYNNSTYNSYQQQLDNLKDQQWELRKQRDAEQKKKDKDEQAIVDYNAQIKELDDTIRYFAEDTLKELFDVDLKGWADNIASALVNAFASGEDAAQAFDKTVADIIKNMVSKMASLYIIAPAMDKLREYLFGTDGKGGVFGNDYKLTEDEIPELIRVLEEVGDSTDKVNDLWKYIDDAYKSATGKSLSESLSNTSGSLGKGIQSITEDTANLLGSYINAIRADVSVIRSATTLIESIYTPTVQAQLSTLNMVEANTRRNAEAAERIESAINSVITVGGTGNKIRV